MDTIAGPSKQRSCVVCGAPLAIGDAAIPREASCSRCGHQQWFRLRRVRLAEVIDLMPGLDPERSAVDQIGRRFIEAGSAHLIIDFSNVEFISSTFMNRLVELQRSILKSRCKLTLCGLNPIIREVFQITHLDSLFQFAPDRASALEHR